MDSHGLEDGHLYRLLGGQYRIGTLTTANTRRLSQGVHEEEHWCRLLCIKASGFARLHAQAESSSAPIPLKSVPVGDLQWAVEWRVRHLFVMLLHNAGDAYTPIPASVFNLDPSARDATQAAMPLPAVLCPAGSPCVQYMLCYP